MTPVSPKQPVLEVEDLRTWLDSERGLVRAVDGVDLDLYPGETLALLGESGCGKSMTALSVLRLLPAAARIVGGRVRLGNMDLLDCSAQAMRAVRGGRIAMIFQEPQSSLNPVLSVGQQIGEALRCHGGPSKSRLGLRTMELLEAVGIPDPDRRMGEYPHQLSGGLKQRVMIAIALAGAPEVLIADEPTTALDVTIQAQVLDLLESLQERTGMAILLITHDLGVVARTASRIAVMYAGHVVEVAGRDAFFASPGHPYTRKLFESLPQKARRGCELAVIRGHVPSLAQGFPGCRFVARCDLAMPICSARPPSWVPAEGRKVRCHLYDFPGSPSISPAAVSAARSSVHADLSPKAAPLLQVSGLTVHFPIRRGLLKRSAGYVRAVDGIDFRIRAGETLALVGESGCGKTTVGKAILQLLRPTAGRVRFLARELTQLAGEELRRQRRHLQVVFQDPYASMNPRMSVGEIVEEGMAALAIGSGRRDRQARVDSLLVQVGLDPGIKDRFPHEFSGGQRQRICIARALAVDPRLVVCDEPTSALDVSVQAQILNLLQDLQARFALAYLFITHNLSVVEYLAHRVAVMYLGRIVEQASVESLLENPLHPYSRMLLSAVPVIDGGSRRPVLRPVGELPSPAQPPKGCHFHPRCPQALPVCREVYPAISRPTTGHEVRCHLYPRRGANSVGAG